MSYPAVLKALYRSALAPEEWFWSAEAAEAFDRDLAAARKREASADAWIAAIETGEGELAEALRLFPVEIHIPPDSRLGRKKAGAAGERAA